MDALRHPDLVALGRRLRRTFDDVAASELEAARVAHARTRDLRDLLMEWEDAGSSVTVITSSSTHTAKRVAAVGTDHLLLSDGGRTIALPFGAILSVEVST